MREITTESEDPIRRRDLSKTLIGSVAGSYLTPQCAQAQGSSQRFYTQSPAEIAAGVKPANYAIPSDAEVGYVDATRFGAVGDDTTASDAALANALLVAEHLDVPVFVHSGIYKLTSHLVLGQFKHGRRMIGRGRPTLKFYGLSDAMDCVVLDGGANMAQIEFRNFTVECQSTGRDGVTLLGSNSPAIDNIQINNARHDGFSIKVSGSQWVEKGIFAIRVQNAGRNGVMQTLSGTNGAFINEIKWQFLEVRGVSKVSRGGRAMAFGTDGAVGPGSKFADQVLENFEFDAQYNDSGPIPSSYVMQCDDCYVENFTVGKGAWENTGGSTALSNSYGIGTQASGIWNGLLLLCPITNSLWGAQGISPEVRAVWSFDFSHGTTQLSGALLLKTNPAFRAYLAASSRSVTGDGTAHDLSGYSLESDRGNNVNPLTGVFTVPIGGNYRFDARVSFGPVTVGHALAQLALSVNVATVVYDMSNFMNPFNAKDGKNNSAIAGSIVLVLNALDTVMLRLTVTGGTKTVGGYPGSTATWFCGQLIG